MSGWVSETTPIEPFRSEGASRSQSEKKENQVMAWGEAESPVEQIVPFRSGEKSEKDEILVIQESQRPPLDTGDYAPILNPYKREFAWKRFRHTLSGGFWTNTDHFPQFLGHFLLSWLLSLGPLLSLVFTSASISSRSLLALVSAGISLLLFLLFFKLAHSSMALLSPLPRSDTLETTISTKTTLARFTSTLFPVRTQQPLNSSLLLSAGFSFLFNFTSTILLLNNSLISLVIVWPSLLLTNYQLFCEPLPEVFISPHLSSFDHKYTRCIFQLVSTIPFVLELFTNFHLSPNSSLLSTLIYALLPLGFAVGLFSSFTSMLFYLIERFNHDVMSLSPRCSRLSTLYYFLFCLLFFSISLSASHFVAQPIAMALTATLGFLFQLDLLTRFTQYFALGFGISIPLIIAFLSLFQVFPEPSSISTTTLLVFDSLVFIGAFLNCYPSQPLSISYLTPLLLLVHALVTIDFSTGLFPLFPLIFNYQFRTTSLAFAAGVSLNRVFRFNRFYAILLSRVCITRCPDLYNKFTFFYVHTLSVWSGRTQSLRVQFPRFLRFLILILFPYHMFLIFFSTLLDIPLVPVFGLPIFTIGLPLARHDLTLCSHSPALPSSVLSLLYKDLVHRLNQSLESRFYQLNHSYYLGRCDNYLVWCTVVERGLNYARLQWKGLELQHTTDCHAKEVAELDHLIESDQPEFTSHQWRQTTQLCVPVRHPTTNSMRAILDNPEVLEKIQHAFQRLIYYVLATCFTFDRQVYQEMPFSTTELLQRSSLEIPLDFVKQVEEHIAETWIDYKSQLLHMATAITLILFDDQASIARSTTSMRRVYNWYHGKFPLTIEGLWILEKQELKKITIQAYRMAVKLTIDAFVVGELDTYLQASTFLNLIQECETQWYLGVVSEDEWYTVTKRTKKSQFSLVELPADQGIGTYLITETLSTVTLGQLNPAVVQGLWSSLQTELYYWTNDDDERYSIQAHPYLFRNLILQAAGPPLGYPLYTSPVHLLSTLLNRNSYK